MAMPRGYSRDLRERLLQAEASGLALVEIARTTGVSKKSLRRWKAKQATGQSLEPGISTGCPRKIGADEETALAAQVSAHPDATLAEHCAQWAAEGHAEVSVATMSRTLARLGITRKKRP
jgi:transposase